jgi:hypothetical protein
VKRSTLAPTFDIGASIFLMSEVHHPRLIQAQHVAAEWANEPEIASGLIQRIYAGLLERLPDGRYVSRENES